MTPETIERFRKRLYQLYLDNPDAEALAQAGCTLLGEIDDLRAEVARLTAERDEARDLCRRSWGRKPFSDIGCEVLAAINRWAEQTNPSALPAGDAGVLQPGPHPTKGFSNE